MKNGTLFLLLVAFILTYSCGSDDDIPSNRPPNEFKLTKPEKNAIDIELSPQLTWTRAIDPDGDPVTYDLLLDQGQQDPSTVLASRLSSVNFNVSSPLESNMIYSWRVIASDGNGGATNSAIFSFTTKENQPPESFNLLKVANNEVDIILTPELSWEPAIDPEGDRVTYELLIGIGSSDPSMVIASDLESTNFIFSNALDHNSQYSWKIIASDSQENSIESETFSFTTRKIEAISVVENSPFIERDNHTLLSFNSKMWIIDGIELGDVWSSPDGINWTEENSNAAFPHRFSHSSVVFDGKMWVIGGTGNNDVFNDVWSSSDGVNWTLETEAAAFSKRYEHTSVVYDNRIWIIGGEDGNTEYNDVWSSTDGINWVEETNNASFASRFGHTSVVFDGRLWVIGGINADQGNGLGELNDVWSSSDGINWNEETSNAEFSKRWGHSSTTYDDQIWVIGGNGQRDVWFSSDGANWKEASDNAAYPGRSSHTSISFDNRIWVISGWSGGSLLNDVWYLK